MLLFLQLSRKTTKHHCLQSFCMEDKQLESAKDAVISCSTKVLDTKYIDIYVWGVVRNCSYNEKLETGFKNAMKIDGLDTT